MFICEQCFRILVDEWDLENHREHHKRTGHWAWDLLNWADLDPNYEYET